jgi:hypothetical protein
MSAPRSLPRHCHLTRTSPDFILSTASLLEGVDPIPMPDPNSQGPVARSVAVGTTISDRPPRGSVRAALPHTALA